MTYDTEVLHQAIFTILKDAKTKKIDDMDNFANQLATAIKAFVATAMSTARVTVVIPMGLVTQGAALLSVTNPAPIPVMGDPSTGGGLS